MEGVMQVDREAIGDDRWLHLEDGMGETVLFILTIEGCKDMFSEWVKVPMVCTMCRGDNINEKQKC